MNAIQSKKEPQYAKKIAVRLADGTAFANCFSSAGRDAVRISWDSSAERCGTRRGFTSEVLGSSPVYW